MIVATLDTPTVVQVDELQMFDVIAFPNGALPPQRAKVVGIVILGHCVRVALDTDGHSYEIRDLTGTVLLVSRVVRHLETGEVL